ncbi:hypothetical protein [Nisaea sp.]|uniref:hypothetical protein n=1 Tax=Nisaea sp. TaxID=2024842 RepID=UPI003B522C20
MSGDDKTGTEERKPFILERPLWRGVFNGVVLCLLMLGAQAQGWLGPSSEVTGGDVYRAVVYGVVFGAVIYLYALWRQKRQEKARAAAAVETRDDD